MTGWGRWCEGRADLCGFSCEAAWDCFGRVNVTSKIRRVITISLRLKKTERIKKKTRG